MLTKDYFNQTTAEELRYLLSDTECETGDLLKMMDVIYTLLDNQLDHDLPFPSETGACKQITTALNILLTLQQRIMDVSEEG